MVSAVSAGWVQRPNTKITCAAASAAVYSMVETCQANGIDPFKYLVYLFEWMPNMNFKIHPEELDAFLSWDEEVQENCK